MFYQSNPREQDLFLIKNNYKENGLSLFGEKYF